MDLIPEVNEIFPVFKFNRNCWAALSRVMKEDGFSDLCIYGNLDVLDDKTIEQKIVTLAEKWEAEGANEQKKKI